MDGSRVSKEARSENHRSRPLRSGNPAHSAHRQIPSQNLLHHVVPHPHRRRHRGHRRMPGRTRPVRGSSRRAHRAGCPFPGSVRASRPLHVRAPGRRRTGLRHPALAFLWRKGPRPNPRFLLVLRHAARGDGGRSRGRRRSGFHQPQAQGAPVEHRGDRPAHERGRRTRIHRRRRPPIPPFSAPASPHVWRANWNPSGRSPTSKIPCERTTWTGTASCARRPISRSRCIWDRREGY